MFKIRFLMMTAKYSNKYLNKNSKFITLLHRPNYLRQRGIHFNKMG